MARSGATVLALDDGCFEGFAHAWASRRAELGLSRDVAERVISEGRLREACERADVDVFVAVLGEEVAGYAWVIGQPLATLVDSPAVTIEQLFVLPQYRARGVARELLLSVATFAQRTGATQMTCAVPTQAREVNRMLARLGFAPAVTRRVAPTALLLRRLRGHTETPADLVHRRRSLRARLAERAPAVG